MIVDEFDRLRVLAAVLQHGSTGRAATALGLTQSGVSQHLSRLRRSLGRDILVRRGRHLHPTPAAGILAEAVQRCVVVLEEAARSVEAGERRRLAQLRVATSGLIACELLPGALASFMAGNAEMEPIVASNDDPLVIEAMVAQGRTDLGITVAPIVEAGLEQRPLCRFTHVLICHPRHRWATRRRINLADLAGADLLVLPQTTRSRRHLDAALHVAGVAIRPRMELASTAAVREMVKIGLGCAVVPAFAADAEVRAGRLHAVSIADADLRQELVAIHRPGECPPAGDELIILLAAHPSLGRAGHQR